MPQRIVAPVGHLLRIVTLLALSGPSYAMNRAPFRGVSTIHHSDRSTSVEVLTSCFLSGRRGITRVFYPGLLRVKDWKDEEDR